LERNGIDESFSRKNKNFDRNGCCRGVGISAGYAEINFSVSGIYYNDCRGLADCRDRMFSWAEVVAGGFRQRPCWSSQ
jgi:hypothetical protein